TWAAVIGHGLPASPGRIGLAPAQSAPARLYALIDAKEGGLYRSDDAGANWIKTSGDPRIWQRGWYFGELTVNPRNADEIWVCNTIVLHSTDGGRTFIPLKGDPTGDDFHALWVDRADPDRRILGSDQGAQVTVNGGATWSSWYNQPTGQFYHVATDNRFPYRIYGAQQDSGAADIPSRTDGWDGVNMTQFHESAAGGESDNIAPDPADPDLIYGGRVDRLDLRSGQLQSVDPTLAFPDRYRGTWTLPLVFGKRDHALYFANQRIFRTTDGGGRWTPISPDLTRPDPGVPATLDAATAADDHGEGPRKGVVYAIGPSPIATADIWAGTDDGWVWRTTDGGVHWINVTPKGLPAWSKIGVVEPSHFDRRVAYIAVDRHRLDDFAPYLWRTRDGGRSWTPIVRCLAEGGVLNAVNVVREDPVRPGLLYAGTERGAFVSFDDGQDWAPLGAGLPVTSVRDIEVHGDDLVIATHGRGFYVMDDIEPLRELAAGGAVGTRLFRPAPAVRSPAPLFTGTPMPRDEPMAVNPPAGAYIDYFLARAPKGPVEIAIADAGGDAVARFSSAEVPPPLELSKIGAAPEWIVQPAPPAADPGAHRFVWNLRCPTPPALAGDPREDGVWVPPGRYTVTLTVDGRAWRAPLEVQPDPRVSVTPAAFARQFALARAIEADRVRARAALVALKADPARKADAEALGAISERLDKLAAAVGGADGAPSPDAESGYRQTSTALNTVLKGGAAKP
ncbi:MAG: WD40/YVTN/BNR-like repeat-containing protein, partial [Caulobacteraceae bacterium]